MIRGFLSGVFWGGAVAALGLGTVSQLTPLPVERISADAATVLRPKAAPVEPLAKPEAVVVAEPEAVVVAEPEAVVVPEPEAVAEQEPETTPPAQAAVVAPVPATEVAPEPSFAAEPAAEATLPVAGGKGPVTEQLDPPVGSEFAKPLPETDPVVPAADAPPAGTDGAAPLTPPATEAVTVTDQPSVAPDTGQAATAPLDVPNDGAASPVLPVPGEETKIALAEPDQPVLPSADTAPSGAEDPAPPAKAEPDEALLKPLPEILPIPDAAPEENLQLVPDAPLVLPEGEPAPVAEGENAATLEPTPSLNNAVDGVTIGRLPRIGDAPPPVEGGTVPPADGTGTADASLAIDGGQDMPPLQKYARVFENPESKPLFSIILIDTGGPDLDRQVLAALPFPVSFVLDPLAPDVASISKIYRDAGQEVIMVATGIPEGATASDLEVTFQAHATALPEAVAVIDTEFGAFQTDRPLATQVVPILKAQGRGLISWDRGLNAADQVARREGLAAAMVFRKLDGKGENTAAVRRALDRAAFKAAQDGKVIVIGQTLPDTVTALLEWVVEGRASSVALAPITAVLTTE
jgi:uncharacterized protein